MSGFAVRVRDLSKKFRIFNHPIDRVKETFSLSGKRYSTDFQALRDISFEVKKGHFLGIVGKNGAGKSTLLKILSRELNPTTGSVEVSGRLALLQLGVGFDRELTGRENAIFSLKVIGLPDSEIPALLERVQEFAEIGEFFDHPVKLYSSGMFSRLSFAVAICVEPDILVVDEVLSVGDLKFSQKCLAYMKAFKDSGRTAILVTHDTNAVRVFCDSAIWLKDGAVFASGVAKEVAESYINYMLYDRIPGQRQSELVATPQESNEESYNGIRWVSPSSSATEISTGGAEILGVLLLDKDKTDVITTAEGGDWLHLLFKIRANEDIGDLYVGWILNNDYGQPALNMNIDQTETVLGPLLKEGTVMIDFAFRLPSLKNGPYVFAASLQDRSRGDLMLSRIHGILSIQVSNQGKKSLQAGYVVVDEFYAEVIR
jgi:ABC-type polysaccharide/polyol phosphate transport system ATPase subunit